MPTKPTYEELEKRIHGLESRVNDLKSITTLSKVNEQMYKHCFDNANIGVCLVEPDGKFMMVNNRMVEIFGYSKKEFEGMNVDDVSHPEDIAISKEVQTRVKVGEIGIKAVAYKPVGKADLAKTIRKVLDETKSGNQR